MWGGGGGKALNGGKSTEMKWHLKEPRNLDVRDLGIER